MSRRLKAALAAVAMTAAGALATAPAASADEIAGCKTELWILWGSNTRTLCDTPRRADGSWTRYREFWSPSYYKPFTCTTYGGRYYASTSCDGGYVVPRRSKGIEVYPVTDATVLHDEPGWLG